MSALGVLVLRPAAEVQRVCEALQSNDPGPLRVGVTESLERIEDAVDRARAADSPASATGERLADLRLANRTRGPHPGPRTTPNTCGRLRGAGAPRAVGVPRSRAPHQAGCLRPRRPLCARGPLLSRIRGRPPRQTGDEVCPAISRQSDAARAAIRRLLDAAQHSNQWWDPEAQNPRQQQGIHIALKFAGNEVANFAAFLRSEWRENDWMWGRLDTVSTMVEILTPPDVMRNLARDQARLEQLVIGEAGEQWQSFCAPRCGLSMRNRSAAADAAGLGIDGASVPFDPQSADRTAAARADRRSAPGRHRRSAGPEGARPAPRRR